MAITDQQQLSEVQYHLLETVDNGLTIASGLWTVAEVVAYFNQRQDRFNKDTGIILIRANQAVAANDVRVEITGNTVISVRRAAFLRNSVYTPIPRADAFDADMGQPAWRADVTTSVPLEFSETEEPTKTLQFMPRFNFAGTLHLLFSALGTALSNSGVNFTVPDECVPAIKWGVISDMLAKVGRAQDPLRAAWAESRYQEGVEAIRLHLGGGP